MSDSNLHPSDEDRILATYLEKLNRGEQTAEGITEDPLLDTLLRYRKKVQHQVNADLEQSQSRDQIWGRIQRIIQHADDRLAVPRKKRLTRWNLAALTGTALLLLLISLWPAFLKQSTPLRVAESNATTITHALTDGSSITLRPFSSLFVIDADNDHYLLEGEAYFDITTNPERTFKVDTRSATISVLGTRFMIRDYLDNESVFLEEGRVAIDLKEDTTGILLSPGQSAYIQNAKLEVEENPEVAQEALDWLDGQLFFAQRPLAEIIVEFEHHFGVSIEIPETLKDETLSGSLSLVSFESALENLALTAMGSGVNVQQIDTTTYRFVFP